MKIRGSLRFVIRSVFEGGVGCESGGRSLKSRERSECRRLVPEDEDEAREIGGVDTAVAMLFVWCS